MSKHLINIFNRQSIQMKVTMHSNGKALHREEGASQSTKNSLGFELITEEIIKELPRKYGK